MNKKTFQIKTGKHILKGDRRKGEKGGSAYINTIIKLNFANIAKPMFCHSPQCYHCLFLNFGYFCLKFLAALCGKCSSGNIAQCLSLLHRYLWFVVVNKNKQVSFVLVKNLRLKKSKTSKRFLKNGKKCR